MSEMTEMRRVFRLIRYVLQQLNVKPSFDNSRLAREVAEGRGREGEIKREGERSS